MTPTPANDTTTIAPNATGPDRIDVQSDATVADWAKRLDVSPDQIKEAVAKVGDAATDVEMHLKGSRSTTNETRVEQAGG